MKGNRLGDDRGAVLVIGLLVLLVATLIGLGSINTSVFETTLSGNERLRTDAFYTAETGVQVGLNQLPATTAITVTAACAGSYYWSGSAKDRTAPKSLTPVGYFTKSGFDASWSFKRFQINATGESSRSTQEIEVQASYGPVNTGTNYNN